MSIVVNGKTELCDTSKDIMSRKNVNNISGILLLILMACNYNNLSIKGGGNFVKNQLSHREVTRFPSWKREKNYPKIYLRTKT